MTYGDREEPHYTSCSWITSLPNSLAWNVVLLTVSIDHVCPLDTQLGFQGAWGVVYTRVDDSTVVTRLVHSYMMTRSNSNRSPLTLIRSLTHPVHPLSPALLVSVLGASETAP